MKNWEALVCEKCGGALTAEGVPAGMLRCPFCGMLYERVQDTGAEEPEYKPLPERVEVTSGTWMSGCSLSGSSMSSVLWL